MNKKVGDYQKVQINSLNKFSLRSNSIIKLFLLSIFLYIISFNYTFAQEESIADKIGISNTLNRIDFITPPMTSLKGELREYKLDLDLFGGILQGFDNNIFLDPSRTRDGFLQNTVAADLRYLFNNDIRLKLDTEITNIIYYRFNDNDLLDMEGETGIELDFLDDYLMLDASYKFEWLFFPHDEDGSYLSNYCSLFLQNNVFEDFYQKIGFKLEYRHFTDRQTLGGNGLKQGDLREDMRYTGEYEVALSIKDIIKVRQNLQAYRNDSNDQYYDYYDYNAFRTKTSLITLFTKNFYSITSLAYTKKIYDDRLSTEDNTHQRDNFYVFGASLLYELTPSFTLTVGYSYRENVSNEPLDKFSGSVWTAGLYYSF